jgi:hypothetical protein
MQGGMLDLVFARLMLTAGVAGSCSGLALLGDLLPSTRLLACVGVWLGCGVFVWNS